MFLSPLKLSHRSELSLRMREKFKELKISMEKNLEGMSDLYGKGVMDGFNPELLVK